MNREIKFRAWDGEKMWHEVAIYPSGNASVKKHGGDTWYGDMNLIPMQFTGLKDFNGKDCYEGDIVKVHNGREGAVITEVKWIEYGWILRKLNSVDGWKLWQWEFDDVGIEVIGNIYENPTLLTP